MSFLKQNKVFFVIAFLCICLFSSLQFVSCSSDDDLELIKKSIQNEIRLQSSLYEDLNNFQGLDKDSELAIEDLFALSKIEKEQQRLWNNILNPAQNISTNWKSKSPESINADLTRLYSQLRDMCKRNNIYFDTKSSSIPLAFTPSPAEKESKYGFGFSSYDGFWPSFSTKEAQLIGMQSKIVVTMIEYLSNASDEEYGINLIQISREPVGKEDKQHIAGDLLAIPNLETKLVRFGEEVKSFAFLLKFKSHTSHARSFVNQLRPPFLLRDIEVSRIDEGVLNSTPAIQNSPFGNPGLPNVNEPLPIVKNVESTFTFLVEYIYEVNRDLENFLAQELNNKKVNNETLKEFLQQSGNTKLEAKIIKLIDKK